MAKITVTLPNVGNPVIETEGFKGSACEEATRKIIKSFGTGSASVSTEYKPEWNEAEDQQEEEMQSW